MARQNKRPATTQGPAKTRKRPAPKAKQPVARDGSTGALCVIMPALNEERTIAGLIKRIPREIPGISDVTVILVDDGSTDRTREVAEKAGALVITHPKTRGVGLAFQAGVKKTLELGADFMVNMDADGQFNPEDIPTLIAPLIEGQAGFVTASRFIGKEFRPPACGAMRGGNATAPC